MDKKELYSRAKEAYYNGEEIMSDIEFDELEQELGLENQSYIGAKHNPSYTVEHPYIMGSLSKVQVHAQKDGIVDWEDILAKVDKYIGGADYLITPKYDGCSFEVHVVGRKIVGVSSRGDGMWGRDLMKHLQHALDYDVIETMDFGVDYHEYGVDEYTLRGEVLVDRETYLSKYADSFKNPRSFVSGVLNRDIEESDTEMLQDLRVVIYDVRLKAHGTWTDVDWDHLTGTNLEKYLPALCTYYNKMDANDMKDAYMMFDKYRSEDSPYALDGFVIKPSERRRKTNTTETRPKDQVAVKFIPMLQETEVVGISWEVKKTGEWIPKIITKPVLMDGKTITKAAAFNYGYLIENRISIGTKLVLSLAGDIIPYIYKITDTTAFDPSKMQVPETGIVDGIHLMSQMDDEEASKLKLVNSFATLAIPSIGPAAAREIADFMWMDCAGDEFFGTESRTFPTNALMVSSNDIMRALGGGKRASNASKAFAETVASIPLKTVIMSCNFRLCGERVAEQVAKQLTGQPSDFSSMATVAWAWCMNNEESKEMRTLMSVLGAIGMTLDDFKQRDSEVVGDVSTKIPVIMTGEPNDWESKSDFLRHNPQYRNTGSWKEAQIVFTNSMDSTTAKMKKARERGIEIRLY